MDFEKLVDKIPHVTSSGETVYIINQNDVTLAIEAVVESMSKTELMKHIYRSKDGGWPYDHVLTHCSELMDQYSAAFKKAETTVVDVVGWLTAEGWIFKCGRTVVKSENTRSAPMCFALAMKIEELRIENEGEFPWK